jgi:hypothetical protein
VKVPAPCECSAPASVFKDSIGQIETATYDLTSLQAESWNDHLNETIERAVERSRARIFESALERVVQQAAAVAEKVCQEMTGKLDVRIEKTIHEAASGKRIKQSSCARKVKTRFVASD